MLFNSALLDRPWKSVLKAGKILNILSNAEKNNNADYKYILIQIQIL